MSIRFCYSERSRYAVRFQLAQSRCCSSINSICEEVRQIIINKNCQNEHEKSRQRRCTCQTHEPSPWPILDGLRLRPSHNGSSTKLKFPVSFPVHIDSPGAPCCRPCILLCSSAVPHSPAAVPSRQPSSAKRTDGGALRRGTSFCQL